MLVLGCQSQAQVFFTNSSTLTVGNNPLGVAATDLNGDGKADLICANGNDNTLTVLTNNGSGGFMASGTYAVGARPVAVTTADVNGDGKMDLICANQNGSSLSVLTNNGIGGFVLSGTYNTVGHPQSVVAADVNGDGKIDLVSATYSGQLMVFTNDGSGNFIAGYSYNLGLNLYAVTTADINGDGKIDLICEDSGNDTFVFTNSGNVTFGLNTTYTVGNGHGWLMVAADLNGDGKVDLACVNASGNYVSVLTNNGSGGFVASGNYSVGVYPLSVIAVDVNGDGKLDLICANSGGNTLTVLTNDGSGGFDLAGSFIAGNGPIGITAADVNGDGKLDLICANSYDNTLSVLTNGTPFPVPPCAAPPSGLVGWWKGDGNTLDSFGGNNGVNQNVTYSNGVVGHAFAFDPENYSYGTYTGIQIADQPAYALTNSLSIEGWVRPRGNGYIIFWRGDNRPGLDPYVVSMQANNTVLFQISDANGNGANVGTTLAYNQWCHLAATLDGASGTMSIYTNGVLAAQTNTTVRPFGALIQGDSPGVGIGNLNDGQNNFPFLGDIDEISLYSRALTAGEIQSIYNAGSAGKCVGVASQPFLLDVDFGGGGGRGYSLKTGFAAVGLATNDFWNFYDRDISNSPGVWRYSGTLTNLESANGGTTTVGLSVSDAPGAWGDASSDPMYATYIYPLDGGTDIITFTNLPSGQYDVLAYSVDGNYEVTAGGTSYGVKTTYDSPVSSVPTWTEGKQYARWRNVTVAAGQPLVLTVRNGVGGYAILAGVQIVSSAYLNTAPSGVPMISSFTPASGTNVTLVTISGNNFSAAAAADIVYFGAVQAKVLSANPNSLTVTVPVGATFAPVTVTVNGLTAYASQPFTPTFAGIGQIDNTSLAPFVNLPTANGPGQVVIADLDGDGKPDLIIPDSYAGVISIYQNISTNGTLTTGSFGPRVDLPTLAGSYANPYKLVVADLDGDGRLDIIALNADSNVVSILRNISSPGSLTTNSFAARIDLPGGNVMRGLAVQDLNGDGLPEIVTANQSDNAISVFQNLSTVGNIAFAPRVNFAAGTGAGGVAIGDLDGDGLPDLVVANISDGTISIFRNLGGDNITTNSFAPQVVFPATTSAFPIAIGDLDGDGKLDLVVGGGNGSQSILVYRNTSTVGSITTSSFAAPVTFAAPGWVNSIALADLDGDGKLDIALVSQLSSVFSIFKNVSQPGSFTTASLAGRVDYSAGYNPNGVAIGDLDGDGRPDVVFANTYDNTVSINQNLVPFGAAPVITLQPTNQTAVVGGTTTFSVTAGGTPPFSYQWNFNGTNIAGATSATLTLTNVQLTQAGNYAVLVTNIYGAAAGSNAVLSVFVPAIPPTILSQTPNQVVLLGNTATFSVNVGGSVPLSYFWQRNGVLIPGATNASYSLFNAQLSDSGSKFSCLVTNAYGTASSTNVSLKVINSTVANDLCSGAIIITNASYTNVQSTVQATSFGDPMPDCVGGFGHGVWYQFTAPVAGLLIVDTFGSDFDSGLAVYTGSCDALTEVACNDDFGGITSQVTLPTIAGTTYYIIAGGYASDAGNLVLHFNNLTPPAFAVQPTNESVVVSSNASFATTLTGTLPMSFQWYFNNTPLTDGERISGSTNATLNITGVLTNDGGSFQLVASNIVGVVTSSVAVLTPIILPPVFTQPPSDEAVPAGANALFPSAVSGTPPYNYQWSFNGTPLADDGVHITGSATSSLSISNLTTADAGSYSLTVTNVSGSITGSAVLTVLVPPAITSQPIGRSVPPGLPTVLSVVASGIPAPTYQWQLNGTNISGATGSTYTNPAVGTNDLGFYQVVVSNLVGSATSAGAQLTFGPVAAWGLNTSGECLPPPGLSNVMAVAGNNGASFAVRTDGTIIPWGSGIVTNIPASASNVVAIATSDGSPDFALRSDGIVIGWPNYAAPVLSNFVSIASGYGFAYGLRAEGTVTNLYLSKNIPLPAWLNHITAVACGYSSALALRSDGTVIIAGTDGITNPPAGLNDVVAIAAGYSYAMVLKSNGTVVAWGSGTGTNLPAGLTNIVAISAGNYAFENSGMAIRSDGTLLSWGDNNYGDKTPPAALSNLVSIAASAPAFHGLALVNDGRPVILQPPVGLTAYTGRSVTMQSSTVGTLPLSYQWLLNGTNIPGAINTSLVISNVQFGNAGNYQLFVSNSVNTALSLPAPLNVISNGALMFLSQPAGQTNYQGSKVTLGATVLGSGPVSYQWYYSTNSVINFTAIPGANTDSLVFDPALAGESGYYRVVASNQFSIYSTVTSPPTYERVLFAKAWGYLPTDPSIIVTNATAIAVGNLGTGNPYGHYLVLKSDGTISSWIGSLQYPQYGQTNFSALSNSIVTAIAAGYGDSLALKSDGTVYAVGYGIYGETNVPSGLSGVTAIACGDYHDLALKLDGTVTGWGQNTYLQTTNVSATNVVAIAAGGLNSIALRADGSVVTWGQFGNGQYFFPFNATNVIAVAAGGTHFLALRANGTVVGWGNNPYGQVTIPATWSNIVAISAGGNHSVALRNDGTILTLGNYYNGPTLNPGSVPSDLANVVAIASSGDHDLALFGTRVPSFTVQPWDRAIPSTVTTNITLAAKCAGVQPVYYQWQLNGTNVPGATNDTLILTNRNNPYPPGVIRIPAGAYQLIASNSYGVAASQFAKITTFIPLGTALNATNLVWTTSGNAQWFGETNVTHDGVSAAQSGGIGPLQQTILQTTVGTNWPGSYTFWWNVSSEQDFDILEFRINGIVQTSISGSPGWQQVSIPVAAGTNTLMWRYYKDASVDMGLDAGWVDQFAFIPAPPQITVQPVSQIVNIGTNVTFNVTATGAPMLGRLFSYQWQHNGSLLGGSKLGGNAVFLTLVNVGRDQDGIYSVTVTGAGGSTTSNAVLKVPVPQLLGSPQLLPNGSFQLTSTDANGGLLSPSDLPNFEAQASTDLVNWVTLPNALSLTNGMLLLQDNTQSNYTARYYRIIER
jgi:alpha-tubulin suppressor-like RCC1 family protein